MNQPSSLHACSLLTFVFICFQIKYTQAIHFHEVTVKQIRLVCRNPTKYHFLTQFKDEAKPSFKSLDKLRAHNEELGEQLTQFAFPSWNTFCLSLIHWSTCLVCLSRLFSCHVLMLLEQARKQRWCWQRGWRKRPPRRESWRRGGGSAKPQRRC